MSHTPKNILIRAVKTNIPRKVKDNAIKEAEALIDEFCFDPTLCRLFLDHNDENKKR